jgi:hypothetical protein
MDNTVAVIFSEIVFQSPVKGLDSLVNGGIPNGMELDLQPFVIIF